MSFQQDYDRLPFPPKTPEDIQASIKLCEQGIKAIEDLVTTYDASWTKYVKDRNDAKTDMDNKYQAYQNAVTNLKATPLTDMRGQGKQSWNHPDGWTVRIKPNCETHCKQFINYGDKLSNSTENRQVGTAQTDPTQTQFGVSHTVGTNLRDEDCTNHFYLFWWHNDCYRYDTQDCWCNFPDDKEFEKRKSEENQAWSAYIRAVEVYYKLLTNGIPTPPDNQKIALKCCVNYVKCPEGTKCLGLIQTCKQRIVNLNQQLSNEQRLINEKRYKVRKKYY